MSGDFASEIDRRRRALADAVIQHRLAERVYEDARREQERRDWECYEMIDDEEE